MADPSDAEGDYRQMVMKILKMHLHAIETLAANPKLPYVDNMVRHASAMHSTSQLLDHVYPEDAKVKQQATGRPWTDRASFDKLVVNSQKSSAALVAAANEWQRGNKEALVPAIKGLREKCRECHDIFREAP